MMVMIMERQYFDTMRREEPARPPAPVPAPTPQQPEQRLELHRAKRSKLSRKRIILANTILATIIVLGLVGFYLTRSGTPIPKKISQSVSFSLYYPLGYQSAKDTFSVQNDIVFYKLKDGSHVIAISEQALPSSPPDLAHLEGFKKVTTFDGSDVAVGSNNGMPVALLIKNSTLITINGSQSTPSDSVYQTAQNMRLVSDH